MDNKSKASSKSRRENGGFFLFLIIQRNLV